MSNSEKTKVRTLGKPTYLETRRAKNKNATRSRVVADNSADGLASAFRFVKEFFGPVAKKFKANAGYGLQHYNQDGFIHPDGVLRLSNQSLALMSLQISEVLSQRVAQKGNKAFTEQMGEGGDPAEAAKVIGHIRRFLNERPAAIKSDSNQGIYRGVMKDLGLEGDIIPATPRKKPAAKKDSGKKPAAKKSPKAKAEAETVEA